MILHNALSCKLVLVKARCACSCRPKCLVVYAPLADGEIGHALLHNTGWTLWMSSYHLLLNSTKANFMWLGSMPNFNLDDLANKFPTYIFQL